MERRNLNRPLDLESVDDFHHHPIDQITRLLMHKKAGIHAVDHFPAERPLGAPICTKLAFEWEERV